MGLPLNAGTTPTQPPKVTEPYPRFPKDHYWDCLLMQFHNSNILVYGKDAHHPFPFTFTSPVLHNYVSILPGSTEPRVIPTLQTKITQDKEPIPLEREFVMELITKMKEFIHKRIDRSGLFENLQENDFRYLDHWIQMAVQRHVRVKVLDAELIRLGITAMDPGANYNRMHWPTRLQGEWGDCLIDRRILMRDAGQVNEATALTLEPETDDESSESEYETDFSWQQ